MINHDTVVMAHGNGGALTAKLIKEIFLERLNNKFLSELSDSAIIPILSKYPASLNHQITNIAYTTDSYVIDPIIFPGGDIGKLSVCGTLNDIAMSGAKPAYLSCGFIIEEGLEIRILQQVVESMAEVSNEAEVLFVAGDTKVVQKGNAHKLFINTSGMGFFDEINTPCSYNLKNGDEIIINGTIGDHGIAVLSARENFGLDISLNSDCTNLYPLVKALRDNDIEIKFMRDATRGGVATVLNEIAQKFNIGVLLKEDCIPVSSQVREVCDILGFDPLYIANEGKMIVVVAEGKGEKAAEILKKYPSGNEATVIGKITDEHPKKVVIETLIKGKRIVDLLVSDQFPRIC